MLMIGECDWKQRWADAKKESSSNKNMNKSRLMLDHSWKNGIKAFNKLKLANNK